MRSKEDSETETSKLSQCNEHGSEIFAGTRHGAKTIPEEEDRNGENGPLPLLRTAAELACERAHAPRTSYQDTRTGLAFWPSLSARRGGEGEL